MSGKVMVVGASGMVGSALMKEFAHSNRCSGTFFCKGAKDLLQLDLRNVNEVRSLLQRVRPDVVLCAAAQANVETCEIEPSATREINVNGLQNLIDAVSEIGAFLVYFSSEYVFDGTCGPYSENQPCNPLNEYGRQKLECEQKISKQLERYLIARISGVYDWEKQNKNFVVRFVSSLASGRPVKVPDDQIITPTYAPNLARVVRGLVDLGHRGCFHLSGSLPMLRTSFAQVIAEVFDLDTSLIAPRATSEMGLRAIRPRSAGLNVDKAQALLPFRIDGPREGLEAMKKERSLQLT